MSLASGTVNNSIDNLVQSSLESKDENLRLEWTSCDEISDVKLTQIDNVYYAVLKDCMIVFLGSSEECTPALVSEFTAGLRVATVS